MGQSGPLVLYRGVKISFIFIFIHSYLNICHKMSLRFSRYKKNTCPIKWLVSRARLSRGERVWSISHHHLVSNMPRISWRVNWVSEEWRRTVALFGMLFRETEDLSLQNASQFMFTPTSLDALLLIMQYKSLMGI